MIVHVEGNIGSGKTTLLRCIKNNPAWSERCEILEEPLDSWVNFNDVNLLEASYEKPKTYAELLQVHIYLTMLYNHLRTLGLEKENKIIIMERSVFSGLECFARVLMNEGKIRPLMYSVLSENMKKLRDLFEPDHVIYLQIDDVNVLRERITNRNRRGEKGNISVDYLKSLNIRHDRMITALPTQKVSIIPAILDEATIRDAHLAPIMSRLLTNSQN